MSGDATHSERRLNPPRRSTDAKWKAAEQRLSMAVEASSLGTFYCPMPLGKIEWNAKCKEHFWLPPDATVDFELFYSILHPDDRERTRLAIEAAVFGGTDYDIEYRTVSHTGQIRWIRAIGRSFRGPDGEPERFDGVTIDITAAKDTEAALARQREELRFLDELSESKRDLTVPIEIMAVVTSKVGRYLKVSRCTYANFGAYENSFNIPDDYTDGCESIVGSYELDAFGVDAATSLRRGKTLIFNDVDHELSPETGADMFNRVAIKALICVPLLKGGKLTAAMAVHQTTPRTWKDYEVRLIEEVVERSWTLSSELKALEPYRLSANNC